MQGGHFIIRLHTDEIDGENETAVSWNHNHVLREMCLFILISFSIFSFLLLSFL